jgi:hypothetical protein
MLIEQSCGVRLAVRTIGTYLARWGFTAQKPLRRAYEQSPQAVRRWLRQDYPALVAQARAEKGTIFWADETGLRSDRARSSGLTRPACAPTICAAAASPPAAERLWCAPVTSARGWA